MLHTATVEILITATAHRLGRFQSEGKWFGLLVDHGTVILVIHGETNRVLIDTYDTLGSRELIIAAVVGHGDSRVLYPIIHNDRVCRRIGICPIRCQPDTEDIIPVKHQLNLSVPGDELIFRVADLIELRQLTQVHTGGEQVRF